METGILANPLLEAANFVRSEFYVPEEDVFRGTTLARGIERMELYIRLKQRVADFVQLSNEAFDDRNFVVSMTTGVTRRRELHRAVVITVSLHAFGELQKSFRLRISPFDIRALDLDINFPGQRFDMLPQNIEKINLTGMFDCFLRSSTKHPAWPWQEKLECY